MPEKEDTPTNRLILRFKKKKYDEILLGVYNITISKRMTHFSTTNGNYSYSNGLLRSFVVDLIGE